MWSPGLYIRMLRARRREGKTLAMAAVGTVTDFLAGSCWVRQAARADQAFAFADRQDRLGGSGALRSGDVRFSTVVAVS